MTTTPTTHRRAVRRRGKPWSLIRLHRECWAAPTVFLALVQLGNERGSPVVTPTREVLSALTGIRRLPTITAALTALDKANWIQRFIIPVGGGAEHKTMLRIVIHRSAHNTLGTGVHAVSNATRSTRSARVALADLPKGKSASRAALGTATGTRGASLQEEPIDGSGGPAIPIAEILGLKGNR